MILIQHKLIKPYILLKSFSVATFSSFILKKQEQRSFDALLCLLIVKNRMLLEPRYQMSLLDSFRINIWKVDFYKMSKDRVNLLLPQNQSHNIRLSSTPPETKKLDHLADTVVNKLQLNFS